ncbi:MAG: carboxypeptidase M32, partial [Alphaproteobacteria bacterium]|nr:carboxypeptidase M32 [Alphaproteobacteria bacterium]
TALVEASSRAASACEVRWRTARAANDFAALRPLLAEVVRLTQERAAALGGALALSPYDALLDGYDPGTRAAEVDGLLGALDQFLPALTERIITRQQGQTPRSLVGRFAIPDQSALARRLMEALGFEAEFGRLDVSHHPFSGGVPDDVRITTRYAESDFTQSLMAVLHETGHALYERGLPSAWRHQPVGRAHGMSLHESQSLLIEMQVCRGRSFLSYLAPILRAQFGGTGPAWEPENLIRLYGRVRRSLIRVEADEVTYPAHVVLRYRLEQALLSGEVAVADLPEAWRAGMRAHVGVVPPDDRDGCLQDIHWYGGDFGYFPTYTLGALAAAQLFQAATAADGDILPAIGRGDFAPLLAWLRTNVHGHGSLLERDALMRAATGAPLGTGAFRHHLEARYLD